MTHPNPHESPILLILGELRGDVKNLVGSMTRIEARINAVEDTSDMRFSGIEKRLKTLEEIKVRIGGMAIGIGLASGIAGYNLPTIIKALIGG